MTTGSLPHLLLIAFALMLVVEGIMPFLMPAAWREVFKRLLAFSDGQLRFLGLASILVGMILIMVFL